MASYSTGCCKGPFTKEKLEELRCAGTLQDPGISTHGGLPRLGEDDAPAYLKVKREEKEEEHHKVEPVYTKLY